MPDGEIQHKRQPPAMLPPELDPVDQAQKLARHHVAAGPVKSKAINRDQDHDDGRQIDCNAICDDRAS